METTKNVGVWIRVSTDMQVESESPEHHERRGKSYAEAKGWQVVEVYRLEAVSGKSVIEQPETKRMLADVKSGKISGLIFSKLARLARNTKELLDFAEIFKQYNADLISLAESIDTSTPAGRLFYTMIAAMATWEREEIAERVAASVPIRANMGKPLSGSSPLGYTWKNKQFVVDEVTAPIRKLIYELFQKNKRKQTTAKALNALGYRTNAGKPFSHTTVGRLIRDTTAKGIRRANYTTLEGSNVVFKPECDWVVSTCEPIVTEELWNECNRILDEQEKKNRLVTKRAVHLLAGYVNCSCGKKMYVYHEAPVYKCRSCRAKIEVADIDEIYHEQLKTFFLTDSDTQSVESNFELDISEKQKLLEQTKLELAKLKKRLKEMVDLRLDGDMSKERFRELYRPLENQMQQMEVQLPNLEAEIDFLKIQMASTETVLLETKDLYANWEGMPFEAKRSIVELITERIDIHKDSIKIALSYFPTPASTFQKAGKSEPSAADLYMRYR